MYICLHKNQYRYDNNCFILKISISHFLLKKDDLKIFNKFLNKDEINYNGNFCVNYSNYLLLIIFFQFT